MVTQPLISADSHVNEPGDLWTERIDKPFQDRAPRVVENPPGHKPGAYIQLEGLPMVHLAQGMGAGKKPEELPQFFQTSTYKEIRPGGWDPAERIKDMDVDGVAAEVIYTTLGFRQFWLSDAALQRACFRAYNDWLAEYCAYAPDRLAGLALISLFDIDQGIQALRRCANQGLRGALIWCSPPDDMPYSSTHYDPFWAAAQDLQMPLSLHSITGVGQESRFMIKQPLDRYVRTTVLAHEVQRSLTVLIFSGVLERFPTLRFVSAENEVGWLPFYLQKLDQAQEEYRYLYPTPLKLKASEYFQRQVSATFIDDPVGVASRQWIGVENIMWSSDYPHTVSTWPHSQEVVARDLDGVPEDEAEKIVRTNAARLYGFDLAKLQA
jgi:predicted TIM-barrel fold metal-dependent hydrolase